MGNALARSKIVSALGAMNADSDLGDTQGGTDPGDDFEHGLYKRAKRSCTATSGEAMVKAASEAAGDVASAIIAASDDTESSRHTAASRSSPKYNLSQEKERKRERNKILARKTRIKKKAELYILRTQVCTLQEENDALKNILRQRLPPPIVGTILDQCKANLPENVVNSVQELISRSGGLSNVEEAKNVAKAKFHPRKHTKKAFCISNATVPGNPIIYANQGFCELTGYPIHQVLGKNCSFLQGPGTNPKDVQALVEQMASGKDAFATLLNYRQDGSTFWNQIQVAPMLGLDGKIKLFVGVQLEVTERNENVVLGAPHQDRVSADTAVTELHDGDYDIMNMNMVLQTMDTPVQMTPMLSSQNPRLLLSAGRIGENEMCPEDDGLGIGLNTIVDDDADADTHDKPKSSFNILNALINMGTTLDERKGKAKIDAGGYSASTVNKGQISTDSGSLTSGYQTSTSDGSSKSHPYSHENSA